MLNQFHNSEVTSRRGRKATTAYTRCVRHSELLASPSELLASPSGLSYVTQRALSVTHTPTSRWSCPWWTRIYVRTVIPAREHSVPVVHYSRRAALVTSIHGHASVDATVTGPAQPRGVRWTCAVCIRALRWRWGGSTLKTGPGGSMAMPARCRLPESLDDDGGCSSPSAPTSTSDDAMPLGHQPYRRAPTSLSTSSSSSCSCWSESWSDDGMEDDATSSDGALLSHPRDHYTSTGAHCHVVYVVASSSMQPY